MPHHTVGVTRELSARYLPFLVGALLLVQLLFPFKGWMILLVGVGLAWLLAYRWARSLEDGLELTREVRYGWAQVGDQLQERFTLVNRGWAPAPWVEIDDQSDLPGYRASRVTGIGERTVVHWFEDATCQRRGLFRLGPTSLRTGDPSGFYSVELEYAASHAMAVMPPVLSLPEIDVAPGGRAGEGRHSTRARETALDAAGVREYLPGDSLQRVHWPTTARRDWPFVRIFESSPSSDWWIFLDLDETAQAGEGWVSTVEHGVILAASLAEMGLRAGSAVGLVAQGEDLVWLPPRGGSVQRWEILRALSLVNPGRHTFRKLLERSRRGVGQHSGVVLITPEVQGTWLASLASFIRKGLVPTVLMLDRESYGGSGGPGGTQLALTALGVRQYLISADLLDRPEARPGRVGRWRRTPQGRWEPEFHRRHLAWRALA